MEKDKTMRWACGWKLQAEGDGRNAGRRGRGRKEKDARGRMGIAERRWRLDGGGGGRVVVMGIESP